MKEMAIRLKKTSVKWIFLLSICLSFQSNSYAILDPYDRSKDIRPATMKEVESNHQIWGLDGAIGTGIARGNANLDSMSIDLATFRRFGDYSTYLLGDLYYMDFNGIRVRNQGIGVARGDYKIGENWRLFSVTTHAYNQYIHLGYRGTFGAGLLYRLNWGPLQSGLSLAPTYEYESYADGEIRQTMRGSFRYLAQVQLTETATTGIDYFYVPNVIDFTNYRMFGSIYFETQVYSKLIGLKLAYNLDYNSSPIVGILNLDTNLSTSLTFHLGN